LNAGEDSPRHAVDERTLIWRDFLGQLPAIHAQPPLGFNRTHLAAGTLQPAVGPGRAVV
jgi:hypothetical protein